MTRLYRLLLRLYPKHIRDEFGAEMLGVFEAASLDGGGLWFFLRECGGALGGAVRERAYVPSFGPAFAGVAGAALLHWFLYSSIGRLLRGVPRAFAVASVQGEQLVLAVMALMALLLIVVPVIFIGRGFQSLAFEARLNRRRARIVR